MADTRWIIYDDVEAQKQQKTLLETNALMMKELVAMRALNATTKRDCQAKVVAEQVNTSKEREERIRDQIEFQKQLKLAQAKLDQEKSDHKQAKNAHKEQLRTISDVLFEHRESMNSEAFKVINDALKSAHDQI